MSSIVRFDMSVGTIVDLIQTYLMASHRIDVYPQAAISVYPSQLLTERLFMERLI
jgi:hypothetical protein